jgi:hypothetical protein
MSLGRRRWQHMRGLSGDLNDGAGSGEFDDDAGFGVSVGNFGSLPASSENLRGLGFQTSAQWFI